MNSRRIRLLTLSVAATILGFLAAPAAAQPGRSCAEAVQLVPGVQFGGSLSSQVRGDLYWFWFDAAANHEYRITAVPQNGPNVYPAAPYMKLHTSGCSGPGIQSGDYCDNTYSARCMTVRRTRAERVYLAATNEYFLPAFDMAFFVSIEDRGELPADIEPDRFADVSPELTPWDSIGGSIDFAHDVDMFRVSLAERTQYRFILLSDTEPAPGVPPANAVNAGLFFYLHTARENYPQTIYGERADSEPNAVVYNIPSGMGGEYYAGIFDPYQSVVGQYRLVLQSAQRLPSPPGPGEPGSSCDTPIVLTVNTGSEPLWFDSEDETRWFAIDLEAGHVYRFPASTVLAPDCQTIVAERGFWPLTDFFTFMKAPVTGRYRFFLTPRRAGMSTIYVEESGTATDDVPNLPRDAVFVAANQPMVGRVDYSGDQDCFRTRLEPGLYQIRLSGVEPSLHPGVSAAIDLSGAPGVATLRSRYSSHQAGSPPDLARLVIPPSSDGSVLVRVSVDSWYLFQPLAFEVSFERIDFASLALRETGRCDDPIPLAVGRTVAFTGSPEPAHVLHFAFEACAGRRYRVSEPWTASVTHNNWTGGLVLSPNCRTSLQYLWRNWPLDIVETEFVAQEDGLHIIRLGNDDGWLAVPEAIALRVDDLGLGSDEAPSFAAGASTVAVGATHRGRIDFSRDQDTYTVDLQTDTQYELVLEALDPETGVILEAHESEQPDRPFDWRRFADAVATHIRRDDGERVVRFTTPSQFRSPVVLTLVGLNVVHPDKPPPIARYQFAVRIPDCPTDLTLDSRVDGEDLDAFINCFYNPSPCARADFNHDGTADQQDLADFVIAFFDGC